MYTICGMVSFLSSFLKDFMKTPNLPLQHTKKNGKFQWKDLCQNAFDKIEENLINILFF